MTPAELLERVQRGGKINWPDFEDVVFEAARKALFGHVSGSAEVARYKKGPIDIVIAVQGQPLSFGGRPIAGMSTQTAYIECKHYNRKLEFDDAAKVFCVAMKDSPNALLIVSSNDMAPQAWEYARHFFTVDENRGVFAGVHFDHRLLGDFLGVPPKEEGSRLGPPQAEARSWVLSASDAFNNRVVSRPDSIKSSVIERGSTYTLEITPGGCTHTFAIDGITEGIVALRLSGACTTARRKPNRKTRCTLTSDTLSVVGDRPFQLLLDIDCQTSGQFSISLPDVVVQRGAGTMDDLRGRETASWTERLIEPDGPNVVIVSGEGGIGKTHFCRRLCDALHEARGYRCLSVTATVETSESIFFRILWSLIVPDFSDDLASPPVDRDLIVACLGKLLSDDRRADAELVAGMIAEGDLRNVDVEVLTYVCARLLAQNPLPRALLISNVHHLAPRVLRALELLFSAIADQGWGRIRIFVEYRTGEETPRLRELLDRLRNEQHGRVACLELQQLTELEIADALVPGADVAQQRDLAAALHRKAGGNPLFLTNVVSWAIDEEYIVARDDGRLTVHDWPGLDRELEALPGDVDQFLGRRIAGIFERGQPDLVDYLIAAAFSGYELDEEQIRRATAMTLSACASARFALCSKGILADSMDRAEVTFSHEIMMVSARSATTAAPRFGVTAAAMLDRLDNDTFPDMLLGGRLSSALHQSRGAVSFYNRGYELARQASAFHQQCLALTGAHRVLAAAHSRSEDLTRRFVDVTVALAEAELMGGSMTRANHALREVLDAAAREERVWPVPGEVTLWRRRALSKRIQVFTRLMRPGDALEEFKRLLDTFGSGLTLEPLLRDSMTRILLMLAMASRPAEARVVAGTLLEMWSEMSANEQSSLCSDIGRIYLQARPEITSEWWHRGVELATDARQLAHSRLNAFVVDVLTGVAIAPSRSADLRRNALALGVHNQIIRIDLADSVMAVAAGDFEHAGHLLNVALRLSRSTSQVFWESKTLNNMGVVAAKAGRHEEAARLFETASSMIEHLRAFADEPALAAHALVPRGAGVTAEPSIPSAPLVSGVWHLMVHNHEAMSRREPVALRSELAALAGPPLQVGTSVGPLYLTLE